MEQLGNFIQVLGVLGSPLGRMLNFEQKKQNLKRKLKELQSIEADINIELRHAESSSGKKRKNEVGNWLTNVARIRNEFQSIEQEAMWSRLITMLGSRVETMTEDVIRLIEKSRFEGGPVLDAHDTRGVLLPATKMVGQNFQKNMNEILGYLANDEILRIGIYGMGGVGKTATITHINNKIIENRNFGDVYWIAVSQDFSICGLQNLIAKRIELDISDEEDESKRAAKLSNALERKCKCILILDGLWNYFSEAEVGIPVKVNGCKLILTSRSVEVCQQMRCSELIKLQTLSEEEARRLFMDKLDYELPLPPEIGEIAEAVVRECDGLPLGIITVARTMRGVDEACEWRNVLRQLKESEIRQDDMEDKVFRVLRFSYNRLNNWAMKQCFMYCALFPEDYKIEREVLIEYLIVEGVIERLSSRQEQFDKGHVMLNKLENESLLEGVRESDNRCVEMHDLIRDMSLQILKTGLNTAMVESGKQLMEIPDVEMYWSEDLVKVSLINNLIVEIPSTYLPRCPNLSTLLLRGNRDLMIIADSFFEFLDGLKVLDLSFTNIQKLPDSVGCLENLSSLLLRGCKKLKHVSSFAKLRALRKLDLRHTQLEEVPRGMEFLSNLTYLDLFGTRIKNFRNRILPNLSRLQHLGLHCGSSSKVIIKEVAKLPKLESLLFKFKDFVDYNNYALLLSTSEYGIERQKLSKYFLLLCPDRYSLVLPDNFNLPSRRVILKVDKIIVGKKIYLPSNIQDLSIVYDQSNAIKDGRGAIMEDGRGLCLQDAAELKSLTIKGFPMIKSLFDLSSFPSIFQSLETVKVDELFNLLVLFSGEGNAAAPPPTTITFPPNGAFSNLRTFHMVDCRSMKKLFHPALVRNFQNLEELVVKNCSRMEEIIAAVAEEGESSSSSNNHSFVIQTDFILPKLRVLKLDVLPELKIICSGKLVCCSLQIIQVRHCEKLQNIPLSLTLPSLAQLVVYPEEWWATVEWDHSTDKSFLHPLCERSSGQALYSLHEV